MQLSLFRLARARVLFDAGASVTEVHAALGDPEGRGQPAEGHGTAADTGEAAAPAEAARPDGATPVLATGLARLGTLVTTLEAAQADPAWPLPRAWHPAGGTTAATDPAPDLRAQIAAAITQVATLKGEATDGAARRNGTAQAW